MYYIFFTFYWRIIMHRQIFSNRQIIIVNLLTEKRNMVIQCSISSFVLDHANNAACTLSALHRSVLHQQSGVSHRVLSCWAGGGRCRVELAVAGKVGLMLPTSTSKRIPSLSRLPQRGSVYVNVGNNCLPYTCLEACNTSLMCCFWQR